MPDAKRVIVVIGGRTITYLPLDEAGSLEYEWQGDRFVLRFPRGGKCDESGAFAAVPSNVVAVSFGVAYVAMVEE